MKIHKNIKVEGKVQGVWYRDSTLKKARILGLAGTVKNISDGSVSIEVEGDEMGAVQKLIDWLYEGPEMAKVTQVSVEDGDWKGMNGFEVIYD